MQAHPFLEKTERSLVEVIKQPQFFSFVGKNAFNLALKVAFH